jgi:hypothetical protein
MAPIVESVMITVSVNPNHLSKSVFPDYLSVVRVILLVVVLPIVGVLIWAVLLILVSHDGSSH